MLDQRRWEVLEQVQTALRDVSAERGGERDDVRDDMDQSAFEMRRDLDLALVEIRSETVARIDEALGRLADGQYGSCVECGREIALARLAAMPFATRCIGCAQEHETATRQREAAMKRDDFRTRGWTGPESTMSGY